MRALIRVSRIDKHRSGEVHTAPMTDDANTLEFFDPMNVDQVYHGIDRASELGVVMKLNDKIRVAVVDLLGPDR